ncbi:hypothetical protein GA0070609_3387 [Micromonospora echinaurantiaca]|uniref:Uncharacterized protein n=1 Tax=Micromonospora echinaurantiaca TaxID=47857 RepID=A0A1C5IIP0_9ACTN|nr:hypothetical protein [Micromonospora echinaurantiaca]SCG57953.1 hypothetical protein GA0070609_3387 [Micromonospora echinaurantiaca]
MHVDEQYGRRLGAQLREELDDVHAAPDIVSILRRQRSRRAWRIRAAIATPIATAAAIAIVSSLTGPGPQPDGSSNDSVQLQNVAYIKAQTTRALSQATNYVIYSETVYSGGRIEQWNDPATQRYRNDVYSVDYDSFPVGPDGQVQVPSNPGPPVLFQSHSASGPFSKRDVVSVDYKSKTWHRDHETNAPPPGALDVTDPDSVEKAINNGRFEVLGDDVVNGVATLHLRISPSGGTGPAMNPADHASARGDGIDLWVDEKTFLAVQSAKIVETKKGPVTTTTYTWLPRTDENLARLVLIGPPGFTQEH